MVLEHTSLRTYTLYTDDDEGPLRGSPVSGMWWQWGVGGTEVGEGRAGASASALRGAGQGPVVSLQHRLTVGLMRRGERQYENRILANYSPASLVLSKIL